jgi:hypothetical protein
MKKWLIGIFVVLALIIVIVLVALQATKGVAKSAETFFTLIREGKMEEAYKATAQEFQAATSFETFSQFLEITTLKNFSRASWTTRSINNNLGKLIGSIHTRDGGVVPVEIDLVKEAGQWKILSLTRTAGGLKETKEKEEATPSPREAAKEIPSEEALAEIINETVGLLGEGINKNDFTDFYRHISKLWQSQTDESSLKKAFDEFISKKIDLTIVHGETPVVSEPPYIDQDGILRLKGYYATQPYIVQFELGYLYEHPRWKLIAINVSTR